MAKLEYVKVSGRMLLLLLLLLRFIHPDKNFDGKANLKNPPEKYISLMYETNSLLAKRTKQLFFGI